MGRAPCCDKIGLKKGPWTPEEDQKLIAYIQQHGHGSWRALPIKAGLLRCGKSCRLRWANYLRPDIKRGKFTPQEEQTIIQLHALLGNRWSAIATHLPKRTDNEIKNYWNTHLKKRLLSMGIDPVTHKPRTETLSIASPHVGGALPTTLSHMAQWESARLEAEARLVRESRLRAKGLWPPPKPHNTATNFFNVLKPSPQSPWPSANKLENATANTETSFTSFLALLQQAMSCPPDMKKPKLEEETEDSKKNSEGDFKPEVTWYDNVTTTKGASNNEAASSATAASDISELSKPENTSMVLSDFHLHSDEITSSNSGFSADSLLEFVVNEEEEERNVGGGEEDYWGNMFNLCCNSPPSSGF